MQLDLIIDFPINIGVESLLIGMDADSVPECTTDTQHKSDLGFWLMANGVCRRLADEK